MATGKRFYWMKLKDSFMTSDTIDYFMSQPDGANYVVLYQMLCLKTINTNGRLCRQIGEVIIPYDVDKIRRDCKWFSADNIRIALNLYKSFGLIYEEEDGTLVLSGHDELVGSETDYAVQKKNQRISSASAPAIQKRLEVDNNMDGCVDVGVDIDVDNNVENVHTNVHTDIRDKRLDIRDKDIRDINNGLVDTDVSTCQADARQTDAETIISEWNKIKGLQPIVRITKESKRGIMLNTRIREYGLDAVLKAIANISESSFLRGQNKKNWIITFEWFVKPNNFIKVLEGNFSDKKGETASGANWWTDSSGRNHFTQIGEVL